MRRVFADTSYFIAIIAANDALHERARALAALQLELVTTAWVMTELAAYLAEPPNRELFTRLLAPVRASPLFVPAHSDLFDRGADLYAQRLDKSWSLVDCMSFVVMRQQNLTEALTGDHHFEQAGFKALLLEPGGLGAT